MLSWLKTRSRERGTAVELYGAVVTGARARALYADIRVPDTPEGRYEMIVLHLFLVLEQLQTGGAAVETLSRLTLEAFITDMDDCLREMGTGDLTVPKKVRRAAANFYERAAAYRAALVPEAPPEQLAQALKERLAPSEVDAAPLSDYVRRARACLAGQSLEQFVSGRADFPPVMRDSPGDPG